MANPEHLEILKHGISFWNEWRIKNSDRNEEGFISKYTLRPDLSGADLSQMRLHGISFHSAILHGANLSGSSLVRADFIEADLTNAILHDAILYDAEFFGANLRGADLSKSKLLRTNFVHANLCEANLAESELATTFFANTNLSEAKNLESCIHQSPSFIDHQTIAQSGRLPTKFLRGCGMPDSLIDYFPSLLNEPLQFHSCFISYSHNDEAFAKRLHADLQDNSVRCWFAPEDMKIGDKFRSVIDESIRVYDKLLLVLSKHSIQSSWVEQEAETAFEKERLQNKTVLFPIRLDDTPMETNQSWTADIRRTRHIGDFRNWKDHHSYNKAFERLLRDLSAV